MIVLITGGLGFLGSHICVELMDKGYQVIVADNLSNSNIDVLDKINLITGKKPIFYNIDVCKTKDLEQIFTVHKIEGVIHLAGYKAVLESVVNPLKYYNNNITGTLNLLELCKEYGVNRFVFSSSATVYGDQVSPLHENMEVKRGTNPYGETKIMIERILEDYSHSNKEFGVIVLRYFNPIGAHESGLIGEDPKGIPNNLMPYLTRVANGEYPYLNIYGDDYNTIDGTGVRDYVHVVDIAKGHMVAMEKMKNGYDVFNLGTGRGTSVLQLVETFKGVNNVEIPFKIVDRRPGDIAVAYANVDKASTLLSWKAQRTLEDMVRDSWNFQLRNNVNNLL